MKVMTILGTRPEIVRLSGVISILDASVDHVLVHTGQNYDDRLSQLFFDELQVRPPDECMSVRAESPAAQIGQILERSEALFLKHRPDRVLILGDTNSGMSAIMARRLGIAVYHMEAGNRCFDDRVPEEVNRRVIDACSTVLMPYTQRSRENLLHEGFEGERIFVTGNPIHEVIRKHEKEIAGRPVLKSLGLEDGQYFLVTMHRAENVDHEARLRDLVKALALLHGEFGFPVVTSFHPRTRAKISKFGVDIDRTGLRFVEPFGFFDFVRLERSAFCILSDSGTVQEEACILGVPNITVREVTERPETLEVGSNLLSGSEPETILRHVRFATRQAPRWQPPPEYLATAVADTVCRIVVGYRISDPAEREWQIRSRG